MQKFLVTQKLLRQAVRAVFYLENKRISGLQFSSAKLKFLFLLLCLLPLVNLQAQTLCRWVGPASGSWATAANWSTNTVPGSSHNVVFNSGGTFTISNVPTIGIRTLSLSNSTTVILGTSSTSRILTINGDGGTGTDLDIQANSELKVAGLNSFVFTLTLNGTAEISGTLSIETGDATYTNVNKLNAANCDINVRNGGTLKQNGTVTFYKSATFDAGSTYNLMRNGGGFPAPVTWDPASTIIISGTKTTAPTALPSGSTIGNLTINCPNLSGNLNWGLGTLTIQGDLNVISTGASGNSLALGTSQNVTLNGNYSQSGGTLNILHSTSTGVNTGTLSIKGNVDQTGGEISTAGAGYANLEFSGTSSQMVNLSGSVTSKVNYIINNTGGINLTSSMPVNTGASLTITNTVPPISGSGSVTYYSNSTLVYNGTTGAQITSAEEFPIIGGPTNLTINNTSPAPSNTVSLSADHSIAGVLTLTSGLLKLGSKNLTIESGGSVYGPTFSASNMVVQDGTGVLKKTFATGGSSFTFPVGEVSGTGTYKLLPVSLNFSANSTQRIINVNLFNSTSYTGPQMDYLNRRWSFNDDQAGIGTYSYTGTFGYSSSDVVGTENSIQLNRWEAGSSKWLPINSSAFSNVLSISSTQTETSAPLGNSEFTGISAPGKSYTWVGGMATDWTDQNNWTPIGVPSGADDVIISSGTPSISAQVSVHDLTLTGGTLSLGANAGIIVGGNFVFASPATTSFDCSSTFTYANSNPQTIYALSYGNLVSTGTAARTLGNGTISICGTFTPGAGTYTAATGNTVEFTGTSAQTIPAITYNNLIVSGARTTSNVTLENGTITIGGSFAASATFTTGNYIPGTSTIVMNSTSPQTIPAINFYNLDASGGDRTLAGAGTIKIANTFTTGTGTYTAATGNTLEFNGIGAQTIPALSYNNLTSSSTGNRTIAGTVKIKGTFSSGSNIYTVTGSTIEFNGNTTNLSIPVLTVASGGNYNNLVVSGTGSYSFSGNVTIDGDYVQSAGTVRVSYGAVNNSVNILGNMTLSGGAFHLIALSNATGATVSVGTTASPKNLNISGAGIIYMENVSTNYTALLVVNGNVNSSGGGLSGTALDFGFSSANITDNELRIMGNLSITGSGKFITSSTAYHPKGVVFDGTGTHTISSTAVFNKVPIYVNSGNTLQLTSNLILTGYFISGKGRTLFTTAGILDMAGYTITGDFNSNFGAGTGGTVKTNGTGVSASIIGFGWHTISGTLDLGERQIQVSTSGGTFDINGTIKTANTNGFSGAANTAIINTYNPAININSGSTIEYNGTGAQTITARSDYQNLVISEARNGANITLPSATIGVAGTFNPSASGVGSWITTGNTIEFKGTSQNVPAFSYNNLTISGSDNKTLAGDINVAGILTMNNNLLQTGANKVVLGNAATLAETSTSYVTGTVEAAADMNTAGTYTFNGSGISLSPQAGSATFPGLTTVRRVTGTPISANGNTGIGRYYEISAANNSNLDVTMVFSYQDHELGGINEANLMFFKSTNGTSGPWAPQDQTFTTLDAAANTVTQTGVTGFSVWTLGDGNAPLPVELVSFEAKKVGTDAELTWTTASEHNSQGFEIQVSADSKEFRKLGFVDSHNGNSTQRYRFTDAENGKSGIRYYRLKQIDFDGKVTYSASKTVRFEAEKLQVKAYPNPFQKEVNLEIHATETGKAHLKLCDLTGKTVLEQEVKVQKGNNNITIGLNEQLPAGVYLLNAQFGSERITTRLLKK